MPMTRLCLSKNIEVVPRERDFAVYHRLFGNLCLMDKAGVDYLSSFSEPKEPAISNASSMEAYLEELKSRFFVVAEDVDERRYLEKDRNFRIQNMGSGYLVKLLQLVMTNDCNLGCKYCFIDTVLSEGGRTKLKPRKMSPELAIETVQKVIDIVKGNGNKELSIEFFGGEPLLNWEAIETVLDYFGRGEQHGIDIHYSVVTNAVSVTPEIAKKLHDCAVTAVVSFDSPRNINRVTKRGGNADELIRRGLNILSQNEANITFNTVIVSSNIDSYDVIGLLEVAKKYNVKMIGLILDLAHGPYNDRVKMENIFNKIIETVVAAREYSIPITGYWHQIFEQIIGMRVHYLQKGYKTCVAEGCKLSIEPDGAVANCKCGAVPMGNATNMEAVFKTDLYKSYVMKACETTAFCRGCKIEGFCSGLYMGTLENAFNDVNVMVKGACEFYRDITERLIQMIPDGQVEMLPFPQDGMD